jgi:hypothetical protein
MTKKIAESKPAPERIDYAQLPNNILEIAGAVQFFWNQRKRERAPAEPGGDYFSDIHPRGRNADD